MKLNEKLYSLRKEKGLSQEELADLINVSRQSISKWELGDSTPDVNNLILIAEIFNCSIDYLLRDEDLSFKEKTNNKYHILFIIALALLTVPLLIFVPINISNKILNTILLVLGFLAIIGSLTLFVITLLKHKNNNLLFKNQFLLYLSSFYIIVLGIFIKLAFTFVIDFKMEIGLTIILAFFSSYLCFKRGFKIGKSYIYMIFAIVVLIIGIILPLFGIFMAGINLINISFVIYNFGLLRLKN